MPTTDTLDSPPDMQTAGTEVEILVTAALHLLMRIGPSTSRTILGNHLLEARKISREWANGPATSGWDVT